MKMSEIRFRIGFGVTLLAFIVAYTAGMFLIPEIDLGKVAVMSMASGLCAISQFALAALEGCDRHGAFDDNGRANAPSKMFR